LGTFLKQVSYLGQNLGPLLVQLPPRRVFNYEVAQRFFTQFRERHDGDIALEARHGSWFNIEAGDLLKKFTISGVAADPACVPLAAEPTGHGQVSYFRLHGSPRRYYSSYSTSFLMGMATRMLDVTKEERVWCIFDNTAAGFAAPNALELIGDISAVEALNREGPPNLEVGA
jgi:uncharacterized protein YecE (DUF72 family)